MREPREFAWSRAGLETAAKNRILTDEVISLLYADQKIEIWTDDERSIWVIGPTTSSGVVTVICDRLPRTMIFEIMVVREATHTEVAIWEAHKP
jgi:hypothetical protein